MIDIATWMNNFSQAIDCTFGERVWFVGLQGSYGRGEATEGSDIDVVVILDALTAEDVRAYGAMLDTLAHRERICGFLGGKDQLLHWEPSDLFQFYHDTRPIRGSLDALLPLLDRAAVERAIKIGACNIYHGCVHNMLHEKSEEILRGLYKSASFVVQAVCFAQTGKYVSRREELLAAVSADERAIVETSLHMKNGGAVDFDAMSASLLAWSGAWIEKTEADA